VLLLLTACEAVFGGPTCLRWQDPPPCPDAYAEPLPTDGPPISADYELTNEGSEAFTYTILFNFLTETGDGAGSVFETVRSVGPGATVRGRVVLGRPNPDDCAATRVRVGEVTKVPAAEVPPEPGECPPSGLRLTLEGGTSATGLHTRDLRLENCGTRDYSLNGYPLLEPLDKDRSLMKGVQILHGTGGIFNPGSESDEPPRPLVLKPGESALQASCGAAPPAESRTSGCGSGPAPIR
jgi:hypothetical protein